MASPVSSLFSSGTNAPAAAPATPGGAPNEQMFLQLLVAQLQNQDPTNPVDSTQYVSQLAQFSELEQLVAIRGDLDKTQNSATASTTANLPGAATGAAAPGTNTNSPAASSGAIASATQG